MACRWCCRRLQVAQSSAFWPAAGKDPPWKSCGKLAVPLGVGQSRARSSPAAAACGSRTTSENPPESAWRRRGIQQERRWGYGSTSPYEGRRGSADCPRRYRWRLAGNAYGTCADGFGRYRGRCGDTVRANRCRPCWPPRVEGQSKTPGGQRLYRSRNG